MSHDCEKVRYNKNLFVSENNRWKVLLSRKRNRFDRENLFEGPGSYHCG